MNPSGHWTISTFHLLSPYNYVTFKKQQISWHTLSHFWQQTLWWSVFQRKNKEYGFELRYYKGHLNKHNVILTQGVDAVCIFVNDTADTEVIRLMADNGVKLLALRCAGYNNVDLKAAADCGITVVRVPAYSPYAVAEYTVALMLSLNRKIPRATWRTRDGNFSLHGLLGFDMYGKLQASSARENSQETDMYPAWIRHEYSCLRPLSRL